MFTYKRSNEITTDERKKFIEDLPFPDRSHRSYEALFDIAVERVSEKWILLVKDLELGRVQDLVPLAKNCNLDTGKDKETNKLFYWDDRYVA
jgi:hypothetical protein